MKRCRRKAPSDCVRMVCAQHTCSRPQPQYILPRSHTTTPANARPSSSPSTPAARLSRKAKTVKGLKSSIRPVWSRRVANGRGSFRVPGQRRAPERARLASLRWLCVQATLRSRAVTPPQASPSHDHRQDPFRRPRGDRARAHADFADPFQPPVSQRQYARENGMPRSTLGDWLRQADPAGVGSEVVAFFRSPPGEAFLADLVQAALLVFHHHNPCGLRPIGLFLRLAGLDAFVACSYGALYDFDQHVQGGLLAFEAEERPRLALAMKQDLAAGQRPQPTRAMVACPDEHFHAGVPCLVAVEPCSGFLLVETYRDHRDGATWTEVLQQATADLPVRIVLLCSDEAK